MVRTRKMITKKKKKMMMTDSMWSIRGTLWLWPPFSTSLDLPDYRIFSFGVFRLRTETTPPVITFSRVCVKRFWYRSREPSTHCRVIWLSGLGCWRSRFSCLCAGWNPWRVRRVLEKPWCRGSRVLCPPWCLWSRVQN